MIPTKSLLTTSLLAVCVATVSADPLDLVDQETGDWRVVVDGVMGGLSTGRVAPVEPGVLRFSGELSLENNGGFSQIRRAVSGDQFAGVRGLEITVRGDGREYNFNVRGSNARVRAGGFQQTFRTSDGEWTTVRLPFDDFRLYSFGRRVANAPDIVPTMIESVGVTLSDKREGPFRLDISSIRTFTGETDAGQNAFSEIAVRARQSTLEKLRALVEADERERDRESTAAAQMMRLAEAAISRGVPLFNDGQPAACAAVYEMTIEAMVALGGEGLDTPVRTRLEQGLAEAKTDRSSSERAWTFRRALDDAYGHLARRVNE